MTHHKAQGIQYVFIGLFIEFTWLFLLTPKQGQEAVKLLMQGIGIYLIMYGIYKFLSKE